MEEGIDYIPCDSPMDAESFVKNRLIDAEEEDDIRIHLATLCRDELTIKTLLKEESHKKWLNFRVRPFNATPLRLAATVGSVSCVSLLSNAGALIDLEDIKGQTPLFVATSSRNLAIMEVLLRKGANPEGSHLNRCTPLLIAVRDGFAPGVKLLLHYGANCEPFDQITTCVPGWPLQHAIVYAHFSCFLALIQGGAVVDLSIRYKSLSPVLLKRLSLPHAILKYAKEIPEFARLYFDCGGTFRQLNPDDPIYQEWCPSKEEISRLQRTPRSLKSWCRIIILRIIRRPKITSLELPSSLHSYLHFEEYRNCASKTKQNVHVKLEENTE